MNQDRKHIHDMKEQITREYIDMMPEVLDCLRDIIHDPDINPIARVQAAALIMDRGLGKPEENIRIRSMEDDMDAAQERLDAIFAQVMKKREEG